MYSKKEKREELKSLKASKYLRNKLKKKEDEQGEGTSASSLSFLFSPSMHIYKKKKVGKSKCAHLNRSINKNSREIKMSAKFLMD